LDTSDPNRCNLEKIADNALGCQTTLQAAPCDAGRDPREAF